MTTGEKITKCRKDKGLTQIQLAEELGVTRQAVSRWESDSAFPETDTLVKMSKLFGVSCDWLLNYNAETQSQEEKSEVRGFHIDLSRFSFEYKSKTAVGGLPLVHINIGFGRTAKGVFAVGIKSVGVVSVGLFSMGIVSIGTFGLGLISLSCIALGLFSAGAIAIGLIALGAIAIGLYAMGAVAVGLFAVGAYANGYYVAVGDVAKGAIAIGKTTAQGSKLSVLLPQYEEMKPQIDAQLNKIPNFWKLFTEWVGDVMHSFYLNNQ